MQSERLNASSNSGCSNGDALNGTALGYADDQWMQRCVESTCIILSRDRSCVRLCISPVFPLHWSFPSIKDLSYHSAAFSMPPPLIFAALSTSRGWAGRFHGKRNTVTDKVCRISTGCIGESCGRIASPTPWIQLRYRAAPAVTNYHGFTRSIALVYENVLAVSVTAGYIQPNRVYDMEVTRCIGRFQSIGLVYGLRIAK